MRPAVIIVTIEEAFMVTDTERDYTGTNFVVIMLMVLLLAVGGYFIVAHGNDVNDDNISSTQRHSVIR